MKPSTILFLGALAVIVIMGIILAQKRKSRLTAEAPATVMEAKRVMLTDRNPRYETLITYKFTVGGVEYHASRTIPGDVTGDHPSGRQALVKYNPDKPGENDVVR